MFNDNEVKIVFIDTEFTGERQVSSLISIAISTLEGDELYVSFSDFDKSQVNSWIEKNVLNLIDETESVNRQEGANQVFSFLSDYSDGRKLYIVTAGLSLDLILLYDLYGAKLGKEIGMCRFQDLPDYLQHHHGIDLNTLFRCAGHDPSIIRSEFVGEDGTNRHNALADVRVVRKCFFKLLQSPNVQGILETLSD